jgi:hypothetical protein
LVAPPRALLRSWRTRLPAALAAALRRERLQCRGMNRTDRAW